MQLQEALIRVLEQLGYDKTGPTVLLAISGGVDSVVMMHLFKQAGFPFAVAHCNFQLRGDASDADEVFVRKLAETAGVPFHIKKFSTSTYAIENGLSIQMAARNLRYTWFESLVEQFEYGALVTAHHLNDSIETTLLNFIRGTGLSGLKGIQAVQTRGASRMTLLRPLLFASKDELLAYAGAYELAWREDESNQSDHYARNFVRLQIIPKLNDLNPNFIQTAQRNMARVNDAYENLDFLIRQSLGIPPSGAEEGFTIDKRKLKALPAPAQALAHLLLPSSFSYEHARQIAENLNHVGFELTSDDGSYVLVDRETVVVRMPESQEQQTVALIKDDDLMLRLPDGTTLFLIRRDAPDEFHDGKHEIVVDAGKLIFPLKVRRWLSGDQFQPFGMGGRGQKLQDFFTNQKLSRIEKHQVWLLVNGDEAIIWVMGMRMDERFKVNSGTPAVSIRWIT